MPLTTDEKLLALSRDVLKAFEKVDGGIHPGFRPAHAKGILLEGVFTPSSKASSLTSAAHIQRGSPETRGTTEPGAGGRVEFPDSARAAPALCRPTPVTVRFSDFAGIPTVFDNDSKNASPRGCAIRFHLAEHVHTDIIGHSVDAFPARTVEGFLEFLNALIATDPAGPHPNAIEQFLGTHPATLAFVQIPKPIPSSFARESFFAVSAFRFTNAEGVSRYGRYRILPVAGNEYLDEAGAAAKTQNFLFDEIEQRLAKGAAQFRIVVQLAEDGDAVDDATVRWPENRPQLTFGEISLTRVKPDNAREQQQIIFDPIPRVQGIEASAIRCLNPGRTSISWPGDDADLTQSRRRRLRDHWSAMPLRSGKKCADVVT